MKIAKKVLAVLVAVMMLAGLTAMAFAAEKKTTAEETVSGTTVTVKLYFEDAVGLKSFKYDVTYDADALEYVKVVNGKDTKTSKDCGDTYACSAAEGSKEAGKVLYGGYFGTELFSSADWTDKGEEGEVSINGEKFHVATFTFNVKDDSKPTEINFTVTADDGFGLGNAKVSLFAAAPTEPSTPAESTPAETTPAESTPAESTPAESTPAESTPAESTPAETTPAATEKVNPSEGGNGGNGGNGGKNNEGDGDNMALAAAAAVVVLAGAAFVVSKKRK